MNQIGELDELNVASQMSKGTSLAALLACLAITVSRT